MHQNIQEKPHFLLQIPAPGLTFTWDGKLNRSRKGKSQEKIIIESKRLGSFESTWVWGFPQLPQFLHFNAIPSSQQDFTSEFDFILAIPPDKTYSVSLKVSMVHQHQTEIRVVFVADDFGSVL